ncbi:MAG TPA: ABC transporter ATP-binding protein [Anaerolineae bacterium]|jgi:ATP-binding cassette subfamily B protein/subfamily B ATP-binding cassette protein MsbA|nr:ABC transporter ATP-binding protein [Anaerolineae bacterium]
MSDSHRTTGGQSADGRALRQRPEDEARSQEQLVEERFSQLLDEEDEDTLGKAYDGRLVRQLLQQTTPYRDRLVVAIVLMIVTSLLSIAGPWIIGRAIDEGVEAGDIDRLRFWSVLFLVFAIGEWLSNRQRIAIMAYVGTKVVADIRSQLFRHLQSLSLNFYNRYSVGRLMSRLISDVGVMQDFITWSLTGLFRSFFMLAGIVVVMVSMNWRLALLTFAVLPLMAILTNYWRVRVRDAYRVTRRRLSLINGYLNESISGIRVTKSFARESDNYAQFEGLNHSYYGANIRASRLSALFFPGVDFIGAIATAVVVAVGGWLVLEDTLTAGVLVAFVLYVQRFFEPIRELAQRYNTFQATMAASERIFELLGTVPDLVDSQEAGLLPDIEGAVEFDHVSFSYTVGEPVLNDISLRVESGERVALVGETGAGKSTIIRLLVRLFDVSEGVIRIDGTDIRQVTRASLRSQLGIVLQDTFLFGGTIGENIRYGHLEAPGEAVVAAAKAVGAHEFITRLPAGYETEVGEGGVNLSVGQRQIISFARALLADPRILILDEATSSVDTTTEKQIEWALAKLMEGRTSFVIAHRLSTIAGADRIVVLDSGRIVELGTHQELLAKKGRYYKLYTMQWAQSGATFVNL